MNQQDKFFKLAGKEPPPEAESSTMYYFVFGAIFAALLAFGIIKYLERRDQAPREVIIRVE